jgi:peptidoglycan LD-endopeptidase CwlK
MDARSEKNLQGVHPRLVAVVRRAAELVPDINDALGFVVTEGVRTAVRQAQLVKAGASRTMNSRHLTGHAVDLAATMAGEISWSWPLYDAVNDAMQKAAHEQGTVLTWGGSWTSFKDGCHWEINPDAYRA